MRTRNGVKCSVFAPEGLTRPAAAPGQSTSTRGLTTMGHMGSQRPVKVSQGTVVLRIQGGNVRIVTSYPSGVAE
jgi:hypothetical protein